MLVMGFLWRNFFFFLSLSRSLIGRLFEEGCIVMQTFGLVTLWLMVVEVVERYRAESGSGWERHVLVDRTGTQDNASSFENV